MTEVVRDAGIPNDLSFEGLFAPTSVAVVGVSSRGRGLGAMALKTLRKFGYRGLISVINPSITELDGVPCYPSLRDVPHHVDLVLILTGADSVMSVIEDAVAIGVRSAIVFASGFSEMGPEGLARQQHMVATARAGGLRILGPNCQGVVSFSSNMAATFSNALRVKEFPTPAPIGYIGQSGAIGGSLFDLGRERGLVPSIWVSTGNQADLSVVDVADYLIRKSPLELLMLYLEQMPEGREWASLCNHATQSNKQLVVLRSGTTAAGRLAVASHTGALVSSDRAFELVAETNGVIPVASVDELLDVAIAHRSGLGRTGHRVAIVSTSGGAGGLAVDTAVRSGLSAAKLNDATRAQLSARLSTFASTQNPVDVTADLVSSNPGDFGAVCRAVAEDPGVDMVLVVISVVVGRGGELLAKTLADVVPHCPVPIAVVYMASHDRTQDIRAALASAGVAVFDSLASALGAAGRQGRGATGAVAPPKPAAGSTELLDAEVMTEATGSSYLRAAGVPIPASMLVHNRVEAEEAAAILPGPFVLKVQSADIVHKTEIGGVRVKVSASDVGAVYDDLMLSVKERAPQARIDGVLVQRMADTGVELLVGVQVQEGGYPPVMTVGLGGTTVELYADLVSELLPIDEDRALKMLTQLKGWPLLNGYRGSKACDTVAAAKALVAASRLPALLGDHLLEFEINPLMVHQKGLGATAVDFVGYFDGGAAEPPAVSGFGAQR